MLTLTCRRTVENPRGVAAMRKFLVVLLALLIAPDFAAAQNEEGVLDVRYCGVGYLGKAGDLSTNYPYLAENVLSKDGLARLSGLMRELSKEANPELRYSEAKGKSISFIIAAADHELQQYKNPLPPFDDRYNSIFSVTIQTMLFDPDSKAVIGIYPWRFTFNEAIAGSKPDRQMIAARYATLFDRPPTEEELAAEAAAVAETTDATQEEPEQPAEPAEQKEQSLFASVGSMFSKDTEEDQPENASPEIQVPPYLLLADWVDAVASLNLVSNQRTLAVAPITFGEVALAAFSESPPGTAEALSLELSTAFETELSKHLGLSVVPGGGAKQGSGEVEVSAQFVATIPDCLESGDEAFVLPTPSYRFHLQVDNLMSSEYTHKRVRQNLSGDATISTEEYEQIEQAYGGRFVLNVVSPDDGDSSDWGGQRVIADQAFKLVRAKRYTGQRAFDDSDQYRKLSLSFLSRLASEFRIADLRWIEKNLSSSMPKKGAKEVQKSWKVLFQERMQLQKTKRKKGGSAPGKKG